MARSFPVVLLAISLAAAACSKAGGEFRHAQHVTVTRGDCAPCHGTDPAAPRPATDADCAACHRQAQEQSPPGTGPYVVEKQNPGSRRSSGRGGANFAHAPHAEAGIPCAECHAPSKWRGNRFIPPAAEECPACHSRTR
ncbi:MAG: hypothetical protein ACM31I_09405 [Deltaproteobacteria bacterium]